MKKLIAMLLVALLCLATAHAAEWPEGLSPAKPHPLKDEVNLDETMGYIMLFPNAKLPVERFCDVLEIYLPREDLERGDGSLKLCDESGEIFSVSFTDEARVELRPLEDAELPRYWGGGTCVEIHLPVSLSFGVNYHVLMDERCFTASEGKVQNPPITSTEAWQPTLTGDFGVSGLYYTAPAEAGEASEAADQEAPEPTERPADSEIVPKTEHEVGDIIHFDLVLGGEAKTAVIFSENDSVYFETQQYTEACSVTGRIMKEDLDWGVVFLDADGNLIEQDGRTTGVVYMT